MNTTALVTGATSGLGRSVALALAGQGWTVLVHGRDGTRTAAMVKEIHERGGSARPYLADLASLAQVAALGRAVAADHPSLGLLVNNAGVGAGRPGRGRQESADGYELRLAVNYLAPVLLTRTLGGALRAAPSQVLNIGSVGMSEVDLDDPQFTRRWDGMESYTRSKFALAAFTFATAEEWHATPVHVNCSHPATYMDTGMVRESGVSPWTSVEEGRRAVFHAIEEGRTSTGLFFNGTHATRAHRRAYDRGVQQRLAELADRLIDAVTS